MRKTHTHGYATFQSPNTGRLGAVSRGRVHLARRRTPVRLPRIPEAAALPVALLTAVLEGGVPATDDLHGAVGAVVAATGGGNTAPGLLELATELMGRGVPVALTTRCPSGQAMPGYGFPGGSDQWWESGAIFTGTLDGLKARVLLALGMGAGLGAAELATLCAPFGGGRNGG